MIYAKPGATFEAALEQAPVGLTTVHVRVIDTPAGAPVLARTSAGVTEAAPGLYSVALAAPETPGTYAIVWDLGDADDPDQTFSELLSVLRTGINVALDAPMVETIRPSVDEVAALERTRTVDEGGNQVDTFTADTLPTAQEVENLIDQAMIAILSQLPVGLAEVYWQRTKHAVALYTAILLEGSYFREQLDQGAVSLYRSLLDTVIAGIQEATGFEPGEGGAGGVSGLGRVDSVPVTSDYDSAWLPRLPGEVVW